MMIKQYASNKDSRMNTTYQQAHVFEGLQAMQAQVQPLVIALELLDIVGQFSFEVSYLQQQQSGRQSQHDGCLQAVSSGHALHQGNKIQIC